MAGVSVRFTNDGDQDAELLWHREMEGGLLVAQHVADVLPGRSRIIRSFEGHSFSMWQQDAEAQRWTMGSGKRQHFRLSLAHAVPLVLPPRRTSVAAPAPPAKVAPAAPAATTQPPLNDPRLEAARRLAAQGRYREALSLFRAVGSFSPTERPKLAARIAHLERMVASEAQLNGDAATVTSRAPDDSPEPPAVTSPLPRCDKCTLPSPCGKVHAVKRSYAEVRPPALPWALPLALTAPPPPDA